MYVKIVQHLAGVGQPPPPTAAVLGFQIDRTNILNERNLFTNRTLVQHRWSSRARKSNMAAVALVQSY